MTETRAVARLPNLDIEILHRRLPDEAGEQLAISLKAQPSFDAFAHFCQTAGPVWPWLALHPMLAWPIMLRALWAPWLGGAQRPLPEVETPHGTKG